MRLLHSHSNARIAGFVVSVLQVVAMAQRVTAGGKAVGDNR
jgi:hypothetical protein